jgi:hypothetical protein
MTEFEAKTIATTTHGRYLIRRGSDENLLVGFHGYAENGETHLRELEQIPGAERWTAFTPAARRSSLHPG